MKQTKWRVLNKDVIKYFAMLAMLLNHIANVFFWKAARCCLRFFWISDILPQLPCAIFWWRD